MRLPARLVSPATITIATTAALALIAWGAYELYLWLRALVVLALVGLFVIGYGLDPVTVTPAP